MILSRCRGSDTGGNIRQDWSEILQKGGVCSRKIRSYLVTSEFSDLVRSGILSAEYVWEMLCRPNRCVQIASKSRSPIYFLKHKSKNFIFIWTRTEVLKTQSYSELTKLPLWLMRYFKLEERQQCNVSKLHAIKNP